LKMVLRIVLRARGSLRKKRFETIAVRIALYASLNYINGNKFYSLL
jgi:hypothetical protein